MKRIALSLAVTLALATAAQARDLTPQPGRGDRLAADNFAGRSEVMARNGMAATSQPLATQVALRILQQGGSAVDAAIAANATLGLVEPTGSGMGGDLFALVWDPKTNKLYGLNASGRAPQGQTLAQLRKRLKGRALIPSHGSLAVTVPGAVGGWFSLHEKFGRLPMAQLLAPAIAYAREGIPFSPYIGAAITRNVQALLANSDIEEKDNLRKLWVVDGKPPVAGQVFRNPDLAHSYELIAQGGRDAYYRGPIARTIDAYMKRIGGPLRYEDFATHSSTWVEPVSTNYRGYDVWQIPPNGQGIAVLQMLNLLEGYDLKAMGHNSPDYLHVMVEAKRLAFADRARRYADPAFVKVPVERLISKAYADERRPLIHMDTTITDPLPGKMPESHDTIFLTTADKDGMMVALIQSNYRGMGSGLVPDGLGFILQDRGEMFALDAKHPNAYAPGKRPFHTIIPGFVTKDGKPFMSYGVMGGAMQPQGHVQVLANIIDFGMNVQEAGDAARWQHEGGDEPTGEKRPGVGDLYLEQGIPTTTAEELRKRGHKVEYQPGLHYGSYEAIIRDANGVYHGGTEMRVDGQAAGY